MANGVVFKPFVNLITIKYYIEAKSNRAEHREIDTFPEDCKRHNRKVENHAGARHTKAGKAKR